MKYTIPHKEIWYYVNTIGISKKPSVSLDKGCE